ncbi:hypothetical protein OOK13_45025 [Streptomyces sp. NBC_00378]|uniref:hypothetical protein n=1 Tax=unclassified Streptomyces TaxID=2593676 RepID=UPI00224FD914|nr:MULTISPECIES: hypothetical protein [unclassified Streptomyces]MCX4871064.1 hypothetical protein [Streptomyces sp. NBC_00906]MCX4902707.1 hypothetical protein [Streptomyces sp. NBC_00892]MCX5115387.1 hypothetical protein [Streptomyces sp. NBC_00378]MCX5115462.1 hypothetical protein [Streptomyces sp. NBC_00378]
MTVRRALGAGPQAPAPSIRAAQADLLDTLPGERLSDLDELRARGVLGTRPAAPPSPRRTLGTGRADEELPHHPDQPA